MKPAAALALATAALFSACTPYPAVVYPAPTPVLLIAGREQWDECAMIRSEIARQQRIAALSGVMATTLVEASVRLNVWNVITGLQERAAIAGCPA